MDFLNLSKKRYSARAYEPRPVDEAALDYVIECARYAPSAVNRQPWRLIVAKSDQARAALCDCYRGEWIKTAPVIIAVCADADAAWTRPGDGKNHADIDAAIITEHICLAAAEKGLGTCWVCNFNVEGVTKALDLPAGTHPVALVPMGYPAAPASERHLARKSAEEIAKTI